MLNLFIDTNVLLNFYSFSSDHLTKLDELVKLMKNNHIRLFLPEQVIDEFNRNREIKLKASLERLETLLPNLQIPVMCHDYEEMKQIKTHIYEAKKLISTLVEKLKKEVANKSLHTDKLIKEIIDLAEPVPLNEEILQIARNRFDRGNPPGKDYSYGDAINWESLLKAFPVKEDLFFVGGDKDFKSVINKDEFSPFLKEEWKSIKHSDIHYYELISQFTKDNFPEIKITDDEIKEEKEVVKQNPSGSLFGTPELSGFNNYVNSAKLLAYQYRLSEDDFIKFINERRKYSLARGVIGHQNDESE